MSRYFKLRTTLCAVLFLIIGTAASASRVPDTGPVNTTSVTDEELYIAAVWEDGRLHSGLNAVSRLHYPIESKAADCTKRGCTNGCTIGFGYNLGAHSRAGIYQTLTSAGVSPVKARQFQAYAGVRGSAAVRMCGRRHLPANAPTLTRSESWELMRIMLQVHKQNVVNRARNEGVLNNLNAGQFAILVALDYQNPTLSSRASAVWRHLRNGRYDLVEAEIRHRSGTRFAPQLQRRRSWEGDYWQWSTNLSNYLNVQDGMLIALPEDEEENNS